jgi:hypothetical protein
MSTFIARSRKRNGGIWGNRTFDLTIVNDRVWVEKRRITRLGSTAAFALCHPEAVRQLTTQYQSFVAISREPGSRKAAIASHEPKADDLQSTPSRL